MSLKVENVTDTMILDGVKVSLEMIRDWAGDRKQNPDFLLGQIMARSLDALKLLVLLDKLDTLNEVAELADIATLVTVIEPTETP